MLVYVCVCEDGKKYLEKFEGILCCTHANSDWCQICAQEIGGRERKKKKTSLGIWQEYNESSRFPFYGIVLQIKVKISKRYLQHKHSN